MPDKYYDESRSAHLTYWVTGQMLKGAGWAAVALLSVSFFLLVVWGIGQFLPDESKEAPSPYGALEQPLTTALA